MEKIKDLIYDKNDILVALVIILIAGLIMFNRIDAIMAYPSTIAGNINSGDVQNKAPSQDNTNANNDGNSAVDNGGGTDANADANASTGGDSNGAQAGTFPSSVYIEPGSSAAKIAEPLISLKLINSEEEFVNAVNSMGVSSKLKSGTFIIPANATLEEIIKILTN